MSVNKIERVILSGSSPIELEKRGQGFKELLSKDVLSAVSTLSFSAIPFLLYLVIGGRKLGGKNLKAER